MIEVRSAGTAQGIVLITTPVFALLGGVLLAPLLATMEADFHGSHHATVLVPLLLTAPALCLALFSPLAGVLSDRIGSRRVLMWALALYCVAGTAPMYLQTLDSILASRLIVGIAEAGVVTGATALLSSYFSGDRFHKWVAYQTMLAPWIAAVIMPISGLIGDSSWRLSFGIYALSLVALMAAARWLYQPQSSAEPLPRSGRKLPRPRHLLLIAAIAIPGSIAFYIAPVELAFLLKLHGAAAPSIAANVTAISLVLAPLGAMLARKMTHIPVGLVLSISMIAMGMGLVVMAVGRNVPVITAGMVIQQMGGCLMLVTGLAYIISLAGVENRGVYSGTWWFFYMVAQFLTPLLMSGLLFLATGRVQAVLAAAGLVMTNCIWLLAVSALRRALVRSPSKLAFER